MSCSLCGNEGTLNDKGFCENCAATLASMAAINTTFTEHIKKPDTAGGPLRKESKKEAATTTRVIYEFGRSNDFSLHHPFSVAMDPSEKIIVMDRPERGKYRIVLFFPDGTYERTLLECRHGSGPQELNKPKGIAVDLRGNIYIPDAGNNRIQRFDPNGISMGAIGSFGEGHGQFNYPCDVEVDDIGILYVADTGNSRIQKLTPQGVSILTIGWVEGDNDTDEEPEFDEPIGVTVDEDGHILIADTNHHRMIEYDSEGAKVLSFGEHGESPGQFSYPSDVRISKDGILYVADMDNYRVQTFDRKGNFLEAFASRMDIETVGGGDVAVDEDGYLLICNTGGHTVMRVDLLTSSGTKTNKPPSQAEVI